MKLYKEFFKLNEHELPINILVYSIDYKKG